MLSRLLGTCLGKGLGLPPLVPCCLRGSWLCIDTNGIEGKFDSAIPAGAAANGASDASPVSAAVGADPACAGTGDIAVAAGVAIGIDMGAELGNDVGAGAGVRQLGAHEPQNRQHGMR